MRVLASWVFGSEGQDGSEQALHFERRATSRTARERASPFACHARVALGGNQATWGRGSLGGLSNNDGDGFKNVT